MLSQADREILVKAIVQAIPTYAMSCFKLLSRLYKELESMMVRFWWGQHNNERKTHWVGWETLCESKYVRGMRFRNLEVFNLALLAKQVWRLVHNHQSLFYKIFQTKYFPRISFLRLCPCRNSSFGWKGIYGAKKILMEGYRWRVGDGWIIKNWDDK